MKPIKTGSNAHHDVYEHPAFGCITLHRVSTRGMRLFGTDFGHHHVMKLAISHAVAHRRTSYEGHFEKEMVVEVYLSEAQWATFVSSVNMGMGVPCTLKYEGHNVFPDIEPDSSREERFSTGMVDKLKGASTLVKEALAAMRDGKMSKPFLRDRLERAVMEMDFNMPYVQEVFDEHIETKIERAKTEIHAYASHALHTAGVASLSQGNPVLTLEIKTDAAD